MSYSITVQGDTKAECLEMLATLLRASAPTPVVTVTAEEKAAILDSLPASGDEMEVNVAAVEQSTAPPPVQLSHAEMRVALRTLLTPHMRTERSGEVRALLKRHGPGGLSEVPDDNLAALLAEAKEFQ